MTRKEYQKEYRKEHPEKRAEERRKYNLKHPEYQRKYQQKRRIKDPDFLWKRKMKQQGGPTLAEYDELFEKQDGCCAICHQPETNLGNYGEVKRLSFDHNHSTGKYRGLLCQQCNTAIGLFGEDIDRILESVKYLLDWI